MKKRSVIFVSQGAVIAALYVMLTLLSSAMGLASMPIQIRFSEALTVLSVFSFAAVPGLFVGCLLSNLLTGAVIWDVIFGSIATLIGAVGTYLLRKHKILPFLPPIISNTVIVPLVLIYAYALDGSLAFFALTVGIGEILSCGVLGALLLKVLKKHQNYIFK
ncbi:MAG: QueT transporter family protein [Clostridia bacterium]|nr:QueT transporter family protein [Clostridia bacterium]